jgi:nucleotide-binding universal stress UspA family protein
MITMKNILVPTDFSECSDAAVRYGLALAKAFDAKLHLLHVVQDPYTQPWGPEAFPAGMTDLLTDWQKQAFDRLACCVPESDRHRVVIASTIASPYPEILRYAAEQDVDLIVLGTHGRGPVAHMLLGSVAERVVRRAPCPVLTVRHPQHEFVVQEPAAEIVAAV